jgi:hypothetical protein
MKGSERAQGLVKEGWSEKNAEALVTALLNNIDQRTPEDPVVGKAVRMLGSPRARRRSDRGPDRPVLPEFRCFLPERRYTVV